MKNALVAALVLGIIGLFVGYLLFARLGNGHIPISTLLGMSNNLGDTLRNLAIGLVAKLPVIRRNILVSGLVGVVVGLVIGLVIRRRR